MADAAGALPTRIVVRKLVFTAIGVLLVAGGITVMYQAMRAVMEVGGYCASGGPYEIRQECPDGVWLMFVGVFAGLIGLAFVIAGTFRGGPKLWVLAWPALFLSLGWNFLHYAFEPPPPDTGVAFGWLICGVVFVLMGGVPLLFVLWNAKLTLWGSDQPASAHPAPVAVLTRRAPIAGDGDLVADLERLASLHRDGQLTDDEYARAKDARLAEEAR